LNECLNEFIGQTRQNCTKLAEETYTRAESMGVRVLYKICLFNTILIADCATSVWTSF